MRSGKKAHPVAVDVRALMRLRDLVSGLRATYRGTDVSGRIQGFNGWRDRALARNIGATAYDHAETVKDYYDLCGEFMVFGWSSSLHFAPLSSEESLEESQIRHQRLMIDKLELREGMTVVDVGCGIGGPMRRVVRGGRCPGRRRQQQRPPIGQGEIVERRGGV